MADTVEYQAEVRGSASERVYAGSKRAGADVMVELYAGKAAVSMLYRTATGKVPTSTKDERRAGKANVKSTKKQSRAWLGLNLLCAAAGSCPRTTHSLVSEAVSYDPDPRASRRCFSELAPSLCLSSPSTAGHLTWSYG